MLLDTDTSPATPVLPSAPASAPTAVEGQTERGLDRARVFTDCFFVAVRLGKTFRRCVHSCVALAGVPCCLSDAGNPHVGRAKPTESIVDSVRTQKVFVYAESAATIIAVVFKYYTGMVLLFYPLNN